MHTCKKKYRLGILCEDEGHEFVGEIQGPREIVNDGVEYLISQRLWKGCCLLCHI